MVFVATRRGAVPCCLQPDKGALTNAAPSGTRAQVWRCYFGRSFSYNAARAPAAATLSPHTAPKTRGRPEVWREFDQLAPQVAQEDQPLVRDDLAGLFDTQRFQGVEVVQGRRIENLDRNNTNKMMNYSHIAVKCSFYLRHVYGYQLQNKENGDVSLHYTNHGFQWFRNLVEERKWVRDQEAQRLEMRDLNRPNTKWNFLNLDIKVVLDN